MNPHSQKIQNLKSRKHMFQGVFLFTSIFTFTTLAENSLKGIQTRTHKPAAKAVKIQPLLSIKFSKKPLLKSHILQNTQPLIIGDKVIQGDSFTGLKAFHKKTGELIWQKPISHGGAGSSIAVSNDVLYFGGSDGFFYALNAQNGQLVWKFFTGSENINSPLIFDQTVYWMASNQKIYAHSLTTGKGLLWIYSGPFLPDQPVTRGSSNLQIKNGLLFSGFYDGSLVAIDLKTGKKKWSLPDQSEYPIGFRLKITSRCLLVPFIDLGLKCLDYRNGKALWQAQGGSSHPVIDSGLVYQSDRNRIYALKMAAGGKPLWSKKFSSGGPVFFSSYREFMVYGSPTNGRIYIASKKNGTTQDAFLFGKGLASPASIDAESDEAWFFSIQGYLHKIRFIPTSLF